MYNLIIYRNLSENALTSLPDELFNLKKLRIL